MEEDSGNTKRWERAQFVESEHRSHKRKVSSSEKVFSQYGISKKDLRSKNILAVGAGTGVIHSIDIECENVAIDPLTAEFSGVLEDSTAELLTGVGESLPFKDDQFDYVINRNVLDHTIFPEMVLSEIQRVLKPSGKFIFNINVFQLPKIVRERLSLIDQPHPHHFSPLEVYDLLTSNGFNVMSSEIEQMDPKFGELRIKRIAATMIFRIRIMHIICEHQ